ncbi:unnamed protein product, partial [Mesorhabditis belari]|uniref:C-type lectin domain-containing protein n=1 Tax=Mesorhabditis belari TaxID=2138241 RepID=A0AAF3J2J1_9BILA
MYQNLLIVGTVRYAFNLLSAFAEYKLTWLGRKTTHRFFCVATMIALSISIAGQLLDAPEFLARIFLLTTAAIIIQLFAVLGIICNEAFPTALRNTAFAFTMFIESIGPILAPHLYSISEQHSPLMAEDCIDQPIARSNFIKGIILGLLLGVSATVVVDKISQPSNLSDTRSRSTRDLDSSDSEEAALLKICRFQWNTTKIKLQDEKKISEALKANLTVCDEGNSKEKETLKLSLESCRAKNEAFEKEKDAAENLKTKLASCDVNNRVLKEEKTTARQEQAQAVKQLTTCEDNLNQANLNNTKNLAICTEEKQQREKENWIYYKPTKAYYYYRSFHYDVHGDLIVYTWQEAERICHQKGAHLVSIHNRDEHLFVNKMILSDIKATNEDSTDENPCNASQFFVWIGLYFEDGKRRWSDGDADDYLNKIDYTKRTQIHWMMCYDIAKQDDASFYYTWQTTEELKNSRFVCKRPA